MIKLTLHGSNVGALDVVLELSDALLELIEGDELVLDDEGDLELPDTVADRDKLGGTPDETFLLDGTDGLLELRHVGLVVPRLHLESDKGLCAASQHQFPKYRTYMVRKEKHRARWGEGNRARKADGP